MEARQRKRRVCPKCNQNLSHAAYVRHQNPMVCPETKRLRTSDKAVPCTSAEDTALQPTCTEPSLVVQQSTDEESVLFSDTDSGSESTESESDNVEIMSDIEMDVNAGTDASVMNCSSGGLSQEETCNQTHTQVDSPRLSNQMESTHTTQTFHVIVTHICLFITFFQLCYRISERGITLLLHFLRAILLWASNVTRSAELLMLYDMIPNNVYFLKKMCGLNSEKSLTTYVVCPKCHALYHLEDCIIRKYGGVLASAKCTFVLYPNHHHLSRRENIAHETNQTWF